MKYVSLEPQVVGAAASGTVMDRSVHPPNVSELHFEFDLWPRDVLVAGFPSWLITVPAMDRIKAAKLTGVRAAPVEITTSELFQDLYPNRQLPQFLWLKVEGEPFKDDFGISKVERTVPTNSIIKKRLYERVVSERALRLVQSLGISHAAIYQF
jgi:hypothetical protein